VDVFSVGKVVVATELPVVFVAELGTIEDEAFVVLGDVVVAAVEVCIVASDEPDSGEFWPLGDWLQPVEASPKQSVAKQTAIRGRVCAFETVLVLTTRCR